MTSKLKLILFYSKVVVIILCAKLNRCKKSRARAMHAWIENGAVWNHDIVRECSTSYHLFWWSFVLQSFKLHEKCITILVIQASSTKRDSLNRRKLKTPALRFILDSKHEKTPENKRI